VGCVGSHDDNFFDLGGDSLRAVRLANLMGGNFGIRVSPAQLFDRPTLAAQAELLEGGSSAAWSARAGKAAARGEARKARITGVAHRR